MLGMSFQIWLWDFFIRGCIWQGKAHLQLLSGPQNAETFSLDSKWAETNECIERLLELKSKVRMMWNPLDPTVKSSLSLPIIIQTILCQLHCRPDVRKKTTKMFFSQNIYIVCKCWVRSNCFVHFILMYIFWSFSRVLLIYKGSCFYFSYILSFYICCLSFHKLCK